MPPAVLIETRLDVMERQLLLLLEDLQDLRALTEACPPATMPDSALSPLGVALTATAPPELVAGAA